MIIPKSRIFTVRRFFSVGTISVAALFGGQIVSAQSSWYFEPPSGFDLNTLDNWFANPDGTGANPSSFDANDTWIWDRRAFTSGTFPVNLTTGGTSAELDARNPNHVYESITAADSGRLTVLSRVATDDNNTITINNLNLSETADSTVAARFLTDAGRSFGGATSGTGVTIENLTGTRDLWFGDSSTDSSLATNVTIGDATGFTGKVWSRNTEFGLWDNLTLEEAGSVFQVSETTGFDFRSFNVTTPADGFQLGFHILDAGTYTVSDLNSLASIHAEDVIFTGTGALTVVPEPATYALLFGGFALGLILVRRRLSK